MNLENQQPDFNLAQEDSSDIISMEELLGQTGTGTEEEDDDITKEPTDIDALVDDKTIPTDTDEEEEEEEDPSNPPVNEEEEEEEEEPKKGNVDYKSVIQKLWGEEIEMIVEEGENGEVIETLLADADVDEETFINILNSKLQDIEDTYKGRVSTDELGEFTKHLINIEKNGGSVKQAIDLYNNVQDPLNSLDLDNQQDQAKALYMRYRAQGMADSDINDMIEAFATKGNLREKALVAKEELEGAVQKQIKAMEAKAEEDKKNHEKALKQYRKDLKESISSYNIKDSLKNKIVDMATKRGEDNSYELDKMYNQMRLDPEKAAELALYMADREAFIKKVSEKAVIEEKKSTMKKLSLIGGKGKKITTKTNNNSSKSDEIDLEELIN